MMLMHLWFVWVSLQLQLLPRGKYPGFLHIPCSRSCKKCFATITVEVVEEQEAAQKRSGNKTKKGSVSFQIRSESGSYLVSHQRLPGIIGRWRWLVISQTSIYSNHKSKCLLQDKISQELQKLHYTCVTQVKFTCQSCFSWLSCLSFAKCLPKWKAHFK